MLLQKEKAVAGEGVFPQLPDRGLQEQVVLRAVWAGVGSLSSPG